MKDYVQKLIIELLSDQGQTAEIGPVEVVMPEPGFGDYSTNIAMRLAKQEKKNPSDLAQHIAGRLKALDEAGNFAEVSAVGGFVNIRLSQRALLSNLLNVVTQRDLYGCCLEGQGRTVVFEYSSPNTNKPLHIGHTRNDTYGAACINLLKAVGYKVVSCEVINDRGIHIMKSMLMYLKFGAGKTPQSEGLKPDHFVGSYYTMFGKEAAQSEESEKQLLEEAQDLLRRWEAGDGEVRAVWKQMNEWFFEGVNATYKREGSHFDEVDFESDIYDKGRDIVLAGVEKGVFQKEEDGSVSVDLTAEGLDKKYLLRKDGTTIYITQDLYLWKLRDERHHPDLAVVTTSAEQSYHFAVLGHLFRLLGFSWAQNFKHLPYEHVYLGKSKMSSRGGNTITADGLLDSVKQRVREVMESSERVKALATNESLVEQIAFGAIKYGYLKYEPNTRIYFDLEQTISVEGNTGPYIQYAYARMRNILKKADYAGGDVPQLPLGEPESLVLRKLAHFFEVVSLAAREYKPNIVCNYLYELAQQCNAFYQACPVLQEQDEQVRKLRLFLVDGAAQVLKNGLCLLGIEAPEEM